MFCGVSFGFVVGEEPVLSICLYTRSTAAQSFRCLAKSSWTVRKKDISQILYIPFFEMFIFIWYVMHISRHTYSTSCRRLEGKATQLNSSLCLTRNLSIQKLLYCSWAVAITMRYWESCQICRSLWLMFSFCKSQWRALHERWMILMESRANENASQCHAIELAKNIMHYSSITCI